MPESLYPQSITWEHEAYSLHMLRARHDGDRYWYNWTFTDREAQVVFTHHEMGQLGAPCSAVHDVNDTPATMRVHLIASALGFVTVAPGDTDDDFFNKHTPRQLAWTQGPRASEVDDIARELMGE